MQKPFNILAWQHFIIESVKIQLILNLHDLRVLSSFFLWNAFWKVLYDAFSLMNTEEVVTTVAGVPCCCFSLWDLSTWAEYKVCRVCFHWYWYNSYLREFGTSALFRRVIWSKPAEWNEHFAGNNTEPPKVWGLSHRDGNIQELLLLFKGVKNNYTRKALWTLCP